MAMDNAGRFPSRAGARRADGAGIDRKINIYSYFFFALSILRILFSLAHRRGIRSCHGDPRQRLPLHHVQHLLQTHSLLLDPLRL